MVFKRIKQSVLLIFLLSINSISILAVAPEAPKKTALRLFVAGVLLGPVEIALLEKIERKKDFCQTIKSPKLWLACTVGSAVFAGLVYYISRKYTPQSKFASALNVKNQVEKDSLFMCRNSSKDLVVGAIRGFSKSQPYIIRAAYLLGKFLIKGNRPFMHAVHRMYIQFERLESAYKYVLEAPEDIPDNLHFKKQCQELAEEIKNLQNQIEVFVMRILRTKQWVVEYLQVDPDFIGTRSRLVHLPPSFASSCYWSNGFNVMSFEGSATKAFISEEFWSSREDWGDC